MEKGKYVSPNRFVTHAIIKNTGIGYSTYFRNYWLALHWGSKYGREVPLVDFVNGLHGEKGEG